MFSMTAVTVLHFSLSLCLHLLVGGQGKVPSCKQKGSKLVAELCFNFNSSLVTWYQAKNNCELNGMILAYVSSLEQIQEILKGYTIGDQVWIGANDEKKEGEFIWVASNEIATELEQLLGDGEPNDQSFDTRDEDCCSLFRYLYANDASCNRKFPYLCMERFTTYGFAACPHTLEALRVVNSNVTLSWKPGFNGGLPQTFTVTYQDLRTNLSRVAGTVTVPRVYQTSSRAVEYSVSGLSAKTPYKVRINASINNDTTACETLMIITKTTGPPDCPINISILGEAHGSVLLSWTPGQEDELPQTFIIRAHNVSAFKIIPIESVPVGRVHTNSYKRVMYKVENVSQLTHYTFSVDVENNFGIRECKDNVVQVTSTSDLQKLFFPPWLIFLLIFFPLVLAAGTFGFIFKRRKVNTTLVLETPNTYDSLTKEVSLIDGGHGTDLIYSAAISLSHVPSASKTEQNTNETDDEPIHNDAIYANNFDLTHVVSMKSSNTDDTCIYLNE